MKTNELPNDLRPARTRVIAMYALARPGNHVATRTAQEAEKLGLSHGAFYPALGELAREGLVSSRTPMVGLTTEGVQKLPEEMRAYKRVVRSRGIEDPVATWEPRLLLTFGMLRNRGVPVPVSLAGTLAAPASRGWQVRRGFLDNLGASLGDLWASGVTSISVESLKENLGGY